MQQFENIRPSQLNDFFIKLCRISAKHHKMHGIINQNILKAEKNKKLFSQQKYKKEKFQTENVAELRQRIQELESQLNDAKQERNHAIEENRARINDLNMSLLSVKTKMEEYVHAKRERDKRVRELEKKINQKVK